MSGGDSDVNTTQMSIDEMKNMLNLSETSNNQDRNNLKQEHSIFSQNNNNITQNEISLFKEEGQNRNKNSRSRQTFKRSTLLKNQQSIQEQIQNLFLQKKQLKNEQFSLQEMVQEKYQDDSYFNQQEQSLQQSEIQDKFQPRYIEIDKKLVQINCDFGKTKDQKKQEKTQMTDLSNRLKMKFLEKQNKQEKNKFQKIQELLIKEQEKQKNLNSQIQDQNQNFGKLDGTDGQPFQITSYQKIEVGQNKSQNENFDQKQQVQVQQSEKIQINSKDKKKDKTDILLENQHQLMRFMGNKTRYQIKENLNFFIKNTIGQLKSKHMDKQKSEEQKKQLLQQKQIYKNNSNGDVKRGISYSVNNECNKNFEVSKQNRKQNQKYDKYYMPVELWKFNRMKNEIIESKFYDRNVKSLDLTVQSKIKSGKKTDNKINIQQNVEQNYDSVKSFDLENKQVENQKLKQDKIIQKSQSTQNIKQMEVQSKKGSCLCKKLPSIREFQKRSISCQQYNLKGYGLGKK
ncbi:hypothetical protein PPERSA_04592 [Pseudocohnilembus persalinus]|uniref:Uncharacterized protein n=1 Tax=Pseudocohnilembus persalinus TaxID=266149 RepID=A0A0V0QAI5_PSEPJ|nr:hypothetical protein PPERSA_04592 [Pseudocohnilembus persalinus]|eukprot:KRW99230.1 hypothetical protein PPERSA_04592 [Pseudocohnilembus persalinus]